MSYSSVEEERPDLTPEDLLDQIRTAKSRAATDELVEYFLAKMTPMHHQIARQLAHQYKRNRNSIDLDEFYQEIQIAAYGLIREFADGKIAEITSWRALLSTRVRNALPRHIDKFYNPLSGQTELKRQIRKSAGIRLWLAQELGREPTDQEVVDETNRQMKEARSDESKVGELKISDLAADGPPQSLDDAGDRPDPASVESDSELHALEVTPLVGAVIDRCEAKNETCGAVARVWFGVQLEHGYRPDGTEVAEAVGIRPTTARQYITRVKQVAKRVLAEKYGILPTED